MLRSLDESIQLLADQPKLGKVFRHRRLRLRLLTHGDYLVFYRERPGVIESGSSTAAGTSLTFLMSCDALQRVFVLRDSAGSPALTEAGLS